MAIAIAESLDQLGVANGDRGAAKERHDGQGGTYMDDPAGYVIQFITDGMDRRLVYRNDRRNRSLV